MNKTIKDRNNENKTESLKISILLLLSFVTLSFFGCSEITAPADVFPPETPKFFTLLGGGDGQAYFRWEKNIEPDLKGYRLYRSIENTTSFKLLVEIRTNANEYVDRFLDYDSTYYYYLTAIDNAGNESKSTDIIEVQPLNTSPPQPPSRLNVSGQNNPGQGIKQFTLSWVPPVIGDLKNYLIYRGADSAFVPNPSTFIDSTAIAVYSDQLTTINQKYYYKVLAVDKGQKVSLPSKPGSDLILSSPALISPSDNSIFGSPQLFQWEGVANAVDYVVFVGNAPFSDVIWSSGKTKQLEINYTGPTLNSSRVYYWWVGVYSKGIVDFGDGSPIPAQINAYSLINSFFVQ